MLDHLCRVKNNLPTVKSEIGNIHSAGIMTTNFVMCSRIYRPYEQWIIIHLVDTYFGLQ